MRDKNRKTNECLIYLALVSVIHHLYLCNFCHFSDALKILQTCRLTFKASIFFLLSSASSVDSWLSEPSLSYWNTKQPHHKKRSRKWKIWEHLLIKVIFRAHGCTFSPLSRALICWRSLKFSKRICLSFFKYSWEKKKYILLHPVWHTALHRNTHNVGCSIDICSHIRTKTGIALIKSKANFKI